MAGTAGEPVPPDTVLTQLGKVDVRGSHWHRVNFSFRRSLRPERNEKYMSLIAGRFTVADAVPLVSRGDIAGSADAVRYTPAEALISEGFQVTFRPSRTIPDHVAVEWAGEWTDEVTAAFGRCFTEYVPGAQT